MKIKGLILPVIAGACCIYAAVSIARTQPEHILTDPPQPPPRSHFTHSIAAVGLIEPSSESITIGSHRSGIVRQVRVRAGDKIEEGQALFQLDQTDLDASRLVALARIRHAKADAAAARVQWEQSRRRLTAARSLDDPRALSSEERADRASEAARLEAMVASAEAAVELAEAELKTVETEIERCTVRSPIAGTVLQVRLREGEFVSNTAGTAPTMVIGLIDPLHLRADIDEFEIARLKPGTKAMATPRGDSDRAYELEFVRFEPLVIPKKSLTGDATERVDTRVLQAIYRVVSPDHSLFVGQQMDVFIESLPRTSES